MARQPVTLPFLLVVDVDGNTQPLPVDGQVVQEPLLPRGTGKALAAVALALLALAGLWYGLLKPTIRSTAQEAIAEPVARAQMQAAAAQTKAQQAGEQAQVASGMAGEAVMTAKKATDDQAVATGTTPFNRRIVVSAPPGGNAIQTFTVPAGLLVTVTDLVFESRGDFGAVRLRRGPDVLITAQTQDFRTLDQHFVSPIIYGAQENIVFELVCTQPVQAQGACEAGLYVGGTQRPPPPASSTPSPSSTPSRTGAPTG